MTGHQHDDMSPVESTQSQAKKGIFIHNNCLEKTGIYIVVMKNITKAIRPLGCPKHICGEVSKAVQGDTWHGMAVDVVCDEDTLSK